MASHLSDLHLLLRSALFSKYPLKVRFFAADVYRMWKAWSDRIDGHLPGNVSAVLVDDGADDPAEKHSGSSNAISIRKLQVDYRQLKDYLEKTTFLLDGPEYLRCKVCDSLIVPKRELIVVCPESTCYCTSHVKCLASSFLEASKAPDDLVPIHGPCPECKEDNQWPFMMKELSLRLQGQNVLDRILRRHKQPSKSRSQSKEPVGTMVVAEVKKSLHNGSDSMREESFGLLFDDSDLDENWIEDLDFESDLESSKVSSKEKSKPASNQLQIVIEDSDWDDVEVLD